MEDPAPKVSGLAAKAEVTNLQNSSWIAARSNAIAMLIDLAFLVFVGGEWQLKLL
jgi:hypothetical protein